jgi:hypothetical protein
MPGNGPKYKPWSTATTTAFFPSENNLDKRIDSPVTGITCSFVDLISLVQINIDKTNLKAIQRKGRPMNGIEADGMEQADLLHPKNKYF